MAIALPAASPAITPEGPAQHCRRVGDDDTVLPYVSYLHEGYVRAFRRLFPQARGAPDDADLRTASLRCMDGRLVACFTGANLPCGKINVARRNAGADAFCRENPSAEVVPLAASGHDTAYSYRCRGTRAVVDGATVPLDARGFGKDLWAPLD